MNDIDELIYQVGQWFHSPLEATGEGKELCRLARLGAAVEAMPEGDSIKHASLLPGEPESLRWIVKHDKGPGTQYDYLGAPTAQESLDRLAALTHGKQEEKA